MKPKKLLSFILAMAMTISLLPTFTSAVFANGGNALPVGNAAGSTQITDFGISPAGDSKDSVFMKISDSELLLLYIADADGRTGKNKPALFWSVYANSAWSTPQILEDDDTADSHPYAYDMGDGRIFVAWSSVDGDDRIHANDVKDAYFLNSFNIKSAFFNKTTKTFDTPLNVTKKTDVPDVGSDFYEDIAIAAVYNSDADMLMLLYYKNEYVETGIYNHATACLLYDNNKKTWLNTNYDYNEQTKSDLMESLEELGITYNQYCEAWYGQSFVNICTLKAADGRENIGEPYYSEISNIGSVFSVLQLSDKIGNMISYISFDFTDKRWKDRSSGLITNESCVSSKICYDGSSGFLFAGFADESGNGGTIECYDFYFKDGMTSDNTAYKAWQPADDKGRLTNKVAAVHTDNINSFFVFEDGTDKYLVYSENDGSGAEIRAIKLRSSFDGENLSAECTPCELVIAKTSGANDRYEILQDCVQDGKIDLLCRLNGSEIQRISHTLSANIEFAELKFDSENPQPGDSVNAVAVVRNSGFEKYSGSLNVDFAATGNPSVTVQCTAKIESGKTVEVKCPVTIPTETKNVTVSASIGGDKKEIALQYIFTPKASDFAFTEPSDLIFNGSAKEAAVVTGKSGIGKVKVKYYDENGVEADPINAGTYKVKIDVEAGTDYTAATDLTADGWTFTILPKSIENATLALDGELTYNGNEQTQNVTLTLDGFTNVTFDVSDNEQTNVKTDGDYTLTVTGTGNFEGTKTLDWNIKPYTPKENSATTARIRRNRTLAAATVTNGEILGVDGVTALDGTFAWADDTTETISADCTKKMTFTPTDKNYAPITVDVAVSTYSSSSGGSLISRYNVKFNTDGGSTIENQTVTQNSKATRPTEPTKEGYIFDGWYTDSKFEAEYDFNTKVTKNITLYAKWVEDEDQEPSDDKKDDNTGDDEQKPTADEWKNPFTDVFDTDWFFDSVKYANENGLMSGTTNTTFAPNESLTRAMLVTILYRLAGEPAVNKSIPFADVKADSYYSNAVIWAQQNGIVSGINENEFAPDENITREQIAVILYRYAKAMGYDVSVGEDTNILSYSDFDDISEYAIEAMQYAVGSGLMKGKTETTLNPKDNATRAETAAMLSRFTEMINSFVYESVQND